MYFAMLRTPIHPGEIPAEQLDALGLSIRAFARLVDVPPNRISLIVRGRRAITADTALRLGHYFGNDPRFWLNLQQSYELRRATAESAKAVARLPRLRATTAEAEA
jgi:addiction module HigA family antidote